MLFLCNLSDTLSVLAFFLLQGIIVASFATVVTYTPEVFSTDSRQFSFALLDSVSKVSLGKFVIPFILLLISFIGP